MAQVTDERLAELIAHCDDLLPYNEAKWRDHQSALRELQQARAKLAGVEGALATALWMLERWEASGLGRDAPSLAEQTKNFLLSVRLSAADSKEG